MRRLWADLGMEELFAGKALCRQEKETIQPAWGL
jgi:hypothetical protein